MDSSETSQSQGDGHGSQWSEGDAEVQVKDTFSILVATDNHLGYLEKDPVRGDDSFVAFEEILSLAAQAEVDMILLGGDLFHENKPSRKTMYITTKLLRKYCLGDKPVSLEFLSDPTDNFPEGIKNVNYMDANLNVAIPVFSIHGNHDDPSGDGNLCALDQLSMTGLVNYFGRSQEIDNVVVKPILLQKGESRLALYGIGNIRDERLHQTFLRRNVKMMRPVEDEDEEPWYNLLVLHQNRVMHGPKSYIPEAFLDDFIDLVIWGHEHECLIDPVYNPQQGFHVSQPGSSVATSLSEGESKEKHVAIVKICKGRFNIQKIRLQSVRPFIMSDVVLSEQGLDPTSQQKVNSFISKQVRDLVQQAKDEWVAKNGRVNRKRRIYSEGNSDEEDAVEKPTESQEPDIPKPLVRLKVEYSGGYEIFNPQRFGQEFVDIVANPRDVVQFYRRKTAITKSNPKISVELDDVVETEKLDTMRVENLVQKYLSAQNLSILPELELADAVRVYVEKDEKDAVKDFVLTSLSRMQKVMRTKQNIELEEALLKEINKEKDIQAEAYAREHPNGGLLDHKRTSQNEDDQDHENEALSDDGESEEATAGRSVAKSTRGRGKDKTTASRITKGGRATKTSTARADMMDIDEDGSDNLPEVDHNPAPRAARSTKGRKARDVSPAKPIRGGRTAATKVGRDAGKNSILAIDSLEEDNNDQYAAVEDKQEMVSRAIGSAGRSTPLMVLDTDDEGEGAVQNNNENEDEEDEEDFLVPKRGAKAKGKARAKSPPKAKAPAKPRATPAKNAAAATDGPSSSASTTRAGAASRALTQPSQTASQTPSRLVSSIGSRKKKLL
ncbi:Double-strand break repair protein mre11a [Mortierella claussenii]|nr:Double-strand break repair protein mre11a [Mortierella claussenii]